MKKIIVPVDFSVASLNALHFATEIAVMSGAEVIIYHSYFNMGSVEGSSYSFSRFFKTEAEQQMKVFIHNFRKNKLAQHIVFSIHIDGEMPLNGIQDLAKDREADFIILGTRGASGLLGRYIGSFASEVILGSSLPVLAIPPDCVYHKPKNVILAFDGKEDYSAETFEPLSNFQQLLSFKLDIVSIQKDKDGTPLLNDERWLPLLVNKVHMLEGRHIAQRISSYVEDKKADWLVVIPRKKSFFEELFQRSVSRELALHNKVPLLALRA